MTDKSFKDYYEILELSPNANMETVERIFRYLAKRFHPDVAETGDVKRFTKIVEAYEVLREPKSRIEYDMEWEQHQAETKNLAGTRSNAESDLEDRHRILMMFYAKRKREMQNPGVSLGTLETAFNLPAQVMDFHLWYFQQKGLIQREESGLMSITAEGVDRVEEHTLRDQQRKLADELLKLPGLSMDFGDLTPA